MTRRTFLKSALFTAVGLGVGTIYYTARIEPHWVEFVERPLPLVGLPAGLAGKKLVQISDLHVGPHVDKRYLLEAFERTADFKADFVVYTGDFVSFDSARRLGEMSEVMARAPRGRVGTAAVLGNHDYGPGWAHGDIAAEISAHLNDLGLPVLRNEIGRYGGLQIVGLDDIWGTNAYPQQALGSIDPTLPAIVLCHNPDGADFPIWENYQGWILSGHTHGGQINPPFLPPPFVPVSNKRYVAGEVDLFDGRRLYINRGLGHKIALRFNARPEITVFTLQSAAP